MSVQFLRDLWGALGVAAPSRELAGQMGGGPLGLDVPFRRLLKNPAAAAVLRRRLPEVLPILQQNPLFAGASLRQLTGFMPEAYSEEFLNAVDAELAACQQPPQPES